MSTNDKTHQNTKRLRVITHRVEPRGGMALATLELLKVLARRGWDIELISFRFQGWNSELPLRWTQVPGYRLPTEWLRQLWFRLWTTREHKKRAPRLTLTTGTATTTADVRVIHFHHQTFHELVREGWTTYPSKRTPAHALYQHALAFYNRWLERRLLRNSKALITVSPKVTEEVRSHLRRDVLIHTVPHSQKLFPLTNTKKKGPTKILFVGALERKGIEKSLRILSMLKSLDWTLTVVGDGHQRKWKSLTETLGLSQRTKFVGMKEATPYFKESDVLLFPSVYEPFGLVITEAIAHGCVPLVSKECGAAAYCGFQEDWLKLSFRESEFKWSASLRKLIESDSLRFEILQEAQKSLSFWDWDQVAKEYEKVLLSLSDSSELFAVTEEG